MRKFAFLLGFTASFASSFALAESPSWVVGEQVREQLERAMEVAARSKTSETAGPVNRHGYIKVDISGVLQSEFGASRERKIYCTAGAASLGASSIDYRNTFGSAPAQITNRRFTCSITIAYKWPFFSPTSQIFVGAGLDMTDPATGSRAATIVPPAPSIKPIPENGATTTVTINDIVF